MIVVRRIFLLILLAGTGAASLAWWRERAGMAAPALAPQWPPLPPEDPVGASLGATPEAISGDDGARWIAPGENGTCPADFPIKAKASSGIYHVPGGRFFERTHADRCYADPAGAEADGYRRSKM